MSYSRLSLTGLLGFLVFQKTKDASGGSKRANLAYLRLLGGHMHGLNLYRLRRI